jgi:hypothetical protein
MKYQEEFFHNQIEIIYKAREDREKEYQKLLQEERSKARRFANYADSGTTEVLKLRCVINSRLDVYLSCHTRNWSYEQNKL